MYKVLVFVAGFPPGYRFGGPGRSVFNLVSALGNEFDFSVVTSDRDSKDGRPYPNVAVDQWVDTHGARVFYCSPASLSLGFMRQMLREAPHDVLYLNSFFSPPFSIAPLMSRRFRHAVRPPTIVAPRGEFSDGALALKSRKKRVYIGAGKALRLFEDLKWHASTSFEGDDIKRNLGVAGKDIFVASNLATPLGSTPPPHRPRDPGTPLRVAFLSRISPKKNLDFALKVLSGMDLPVAFSIIGPEEDAAYSAQCRALAAALPDTVTVEWVGALRPDQIPQAMADHDLFFLPTRGENFGHVIAEALGAGTPVLLSDTTPWRGLDDLGVGRDLPLNDIEGFRNALKGAWHQHPTDAAQTRVRAAAYARARQKDDADVEANRAMFRAALSGN